MDTRVQTGVGLVGVKLGMAEEWKKKACHFD